MDNEIKSMPMVPLRGMTILPEMVVHFDVSRQRSIAAVQEAMAEGQEIFLVTQRSIDTEDPDAEDVFEIGTVAQVRQIIRLPKQILRVMVAGEHRGRLQEIEYKDPYMRAKVAVIDEGFDDAEEDVSTEAMERSLKDMLIDFAARNGKMSKESVSQLVEIRGLRRLVDEIAANIPLQYTDQQELLSETEAGVQTRQRDGDHEYQRGDPQESKGAGGPPSAGVHPARAAQTDPGGTGGRFHSI